MSKEIHAVTHLTTDFLLSYKFFNVPACVGSMYSIYEPSGLLSTGIEPSYHRRRLKTEEKAKVVVVGWGMYLNVKLTI